MVVAEMAMAEDSKLERLPKYQLLRKTSSDYTKQQPKLQKQHLIDIYGLVGGYGGGGGGHHGGGLRGGGGEHYGGGGGGGRGHHGGGGGHYGGGGGGEKRHGGGGGGGGGGHSGGGGGGGYADGSHKLIGGETSAVAAAKAKFIQLYNQAAA
ncbi:hypothetical protein SK128_017754, partial [Halocaridina rubra]